MATLDLHHEEGEEEIEHGHTEAHAVHSLVADEDITIHMTFDPREGRPHPSLTEPWDLQTEGPELVLPGK